MIIFSYILYYLVILPLSWLPLPVLYVLSDFLYLILYPLLGYRKKIVMSNLRNSFPEKKEDDLKVISRKFYHHFCDLIVESIRQFSISKKEINKRMIALNPEIFRKYEKEKISIILAGGHFNNWELFAVAIDQYMEHQAIGIYKPLSNLFFDKKMRVSRSRYGLMMISTKRIGEVLEESVTKLTATIFAVDQSPSNPMKSYWMKWLNQDTAMLFGTERYSVKYNYPVLYGRINKVSRGHYSFEFVEIFHDPQSTPGGAVTEKINRMLEEDIRASPEYWLWTHRRWKHRKPAEAGS